MENKVLSFAAKFEADETFDAERFIKLRVWVMHDGKNLNGSTFSLNAIEDAKATLANIPILANVIKKEDGTYDFGGHDYEVGSDDEGNTVVTYLEQPIGVVPETNNYEIIEKDGKSYVVVDAYVWRGYSNKSSDLIEASEKFDVSMEVLVDEYSIGKDKSFNIDKFKYTGITMLGTDKMPAMSGANAEITKFSVDEVATKISEYTAELAKFFAKEEEVIVEEEQEFEVDNVESEDVACDNKEKFELTMREKREKLSDSLADEIVSDDDGNIVSAKYYWVMDFSDTYAFINVCQYGIEDGQKDMNVRAKYDAETLTIDKSTFEEVFSKYLTQAEIDLIDASKATMQAKIAEYESQTEQLNNEIAVLSEFKRQADEHSHKCAIDDKLEEFEHELGNNDEFKTLKTDAYSMEVDAVERECFAIIGRAKHKPASKEKKSKPFSFVGTNNSNSQGKYGELDKYFEKK